MSAPLVQLTRTPSQAGAPAPAPSDAIPLVRKPSWLKVKAPGGESYIRIKGMMRELGLHTVCAVMTADFLAFSKQVGNDLSTPVPEYGFPGLKPGDRWCLCAPRWKEALDAGAAPQLVLEATHEETLAIVPLGVLKDYAFEG